MLTNRLQREPGQEVEEDGLAVRYLRALRAARMALIQANVPPNDPLWRAVARAWNAAASLRGPAAAAADRWW
jgi:hypothetical protein